MRLDFSTSGRWLLRLAALTCLCLIAITEAGAQTSTSITASNIQNGFGAKLPTGSLCMSPTDANANPIAIQIAGRVYQPGQVFCTAVTAGTPSALSVPNPGMTVPSGIHYTVTVKQGALQVLACPLVTFSGSSYDLDTFMLANCTIAGGSSAGGPLYINVTSPPFNAQGNGQVGIGSVSSPLNVVNVTSSTTTPSAADVGKTFWMSEAPYGAPLLTNSYACTNSGSNSFPSCSGTGTMGNSTDTHVYYVLQELGSNGTGQASIEGAIFIPAGNTGTAGAHIVSPVAVNGATQYKIFASIDPVVDGDHAAGYASGTEVLQTQCGSSGTVNIGTDCELDSIMTGTAQPAATSMLSTTITSATGTTITLAASLPAPVAGNQFSWGTADDAAFTAAEGTVLANRGSTLFVPASPNGGCYYMTTGLTTSNYYFSMLGSGPANGVIQNYANVQQGIPYTAGGPSELCTPANINIVSILSPTTPRQLHQGPTIEKISFSDVSGPPGNAKGAIYMEDVNHFTIRDNGFSFFVHPGQSAPTGETGAGGEGGASAIACNVNDLGVLDQCQYGEVENNSAFYVNNFFKIYNGGSSEIVFVANRAIAASTGGNRGFLLECNDGITSGGNNSFLRDTMVYFGGMAFDLCDQNADYIVSRAENTISPASNIVGHTNTGTGAWLHGTGALGPNNQVSIQGPGVPGISESTFVVTVNAGTTSFPAAFGSPGNTNLPDVSISNVPVNQYNGLYPMTALGPCASCGAGGASLAANQLQYNLCNVFGTCTTGLASSGQGTALVSNTCQQNTITGAMVNFDYGLIVGPECDSTFMGALNLGPTNHNQLLDVGTDSQELTNQGAKLQAQTASVPGLTVSPGLAAGTMTTDLFQVWTGANGTGTDALHVDPTQTTSAGTGIADAGTIQATIHANGSVANDVTTGTFQNALVSWSTAQQAIIAPASSPGGNVTGVCGASCGTSGNPVIVGANSLTTVYADAAVTAGHYLGISSTEDGSVSDLGTTAPASPVIFAKTGGALGNPPTLNGASTPAGTSTFPTGTLWVSATCVNAVGGQTKMQSADISESVSNAVTLVINAPTCNAQDVGWYAQATHVGQSSGQETQQVATSPQCHTVPIHLTGTGNVAACALTSNWGAGSVGTGSTPPGSSTDGPLVNAFITLP